MAWTDIAGGSGRGLAQIWPGEGRRPAPVIERDTRPTLLVIGIDGQAGVLAELGEKAGFRCVGTVSPDGVAQRLAMTISVDVILADLRGAELDSSNASALARRHGLADTALAVVADLAGLDRLLAGLDGPGTEFLCEPDTSEIVTLLVTAALLAEQRHAEPQLHDRAREGDGARIEQLSEEVRRLAVTIDRLTHHGIRGTTGAALFADGPPMQEERPEPDDGIDGANQPTHGEIRSLLRARRMREQYLPADLFADPAWDMILDLMAARLSGQRVSVSSLCIAAAVPPTTALRWIRQLTERGVFARIDDPADGRRVFIELTDSAADAFTGWAGAVRRAGGLLSPPGRR